MGRPKGLRYRDSKTALEGFRPIDGPAQFSRPAKPPWRLARRLAAAAQVEFFGACGEVKPPEPLVRRRRPDRLDAAVGDVAEPRRAVPVVAAHRDGAVTEDRHLPPQE